MLEATYAPQTAVPVHDHIRAGWTLTLTGDYVERFRREQHVAPAGSVLGKPADARHSNRYGRLGARCFLIGVDTCHPDTHPAVSQSLQQVAFHTHGPVSTIVQRMYREFLARECAWTLVLEGLLLELSAQLARLAERLDPRRLPPWLVRVREQLHASAGETPTFAALAAAAGIHPVHLSRAFRKAYGMSPGHYLREIRIARAKQLLQQQSLPITQVAAATGFCDQSHLTRTFRRVTGMTPAIYRRRV